MIRIRHNNILTNYISTFKPVYNSYKLKNIQCLKLMILILVLELIYF